MANDNNERCAMCKVVSETLLHECAQECIFQKYFTVVGEFEMLLRHYGYKLLKDILEHKDAVDPVDLSLWIKYKLVDLRAISPKVPLPNLAQNTCPAKTGSSFSSNTLFSFVSSAFTSFSSTSATLGESTSTFIQHPQSNIPLQHSPLPPLPSRTSFHPHPTSTFQHLHPAPFSSTSSLPTSIPPFALPAASTCVPYNTRFQISLDSISTSHSVSFIGATEGASTSTPIPHPHSSVSLQQSSLLGFPSSTSSQPNPARPSTTSSLPTSIPPLALPAASTHPASPSSPPFCSPLGSPSSTPTSSPRTSIPPLALPAASTRLPYNTRSQKTVQPTLQVVSPGISSQVDRLAVSRKRKGRVPCHKNCYCKRA